MSLFLFVVKCWNINLKKKCYFYILFVLLKFNWVISPCQIKDKALKVELQNFNLTLIYLSILLTPTFLLKKVTFCILLLDRLIVTITKEINLNPNSFWKKEQTINISECKILNKRIVIFYHRVPKSVHFFRFPYVCTNFSIELSIIIMSKIFLRY